MTEHKGLPVAGYRPQSNDAVALVNANKLAEEHLLRLLDDMKGCEAYDQRWMAIARTHIEQGFMALNRSVFKPARVDVDAAQGR